MEPFKVKQMLVKFVKLIKLVKQIIKFVKQIIKLVKLIITFLVQQLMERFKIIKRFNKFKLSLSYKRCYIQQFKIIKYLKVWQQ